MFLLGKKVGMSQMFSDDGKVTPVTVVQAGPMIVTQIKTKEKDGYEATQFAYEETKKIKKPLKGHLGDLGNFKHIKESKIKNPDLDLKRGDNIDVSTFNVGDVVKVSGVSKAKGFQGVVKRHGFKGAPKSHGHKGNLRKPGSIGQRFPQHTLKGVRMGGRMGGVEITVRGLKVVTVDKENNLLAIKGAVPGRKGTLLAISKMKN
ncbi:MAG: 50S ribosomal protein L3 [Candidatus Yanofskybacteria bacterium CG10_big_fil_rev_8_21_14_0_10_36_16]|uniref:Large ribosomal subunit protein uL3 n=1 Tax=Candidatus Yanofskybacteria bacterium CG10_big_fil_rev_8_21_14_0_10_36_16 TaxID=1975096 RepID=A0A2J0Q891_9BACT|nr:MAG: 50S ribosomal protein L3 [Candidatus Yanofskybacteria bacterium CG10_big_fil_rev_8_21_14_0_10_36_16]